MLHHGLRTLVKQGDHAALKLVGFTGDRLRADRPHLAGGLVPWNGSLTFTAVVTNDGETEATVAIDYSIGFLRPNGSVRPKTFKLVTRHLAPGLSTVVTKTHSFRPITTRTDHPGPHHVMVRASGKISPPADLVLDVDIGGRAMGGTGRTRTARSEPHD